MLNLGNVLELVIDGFDDGAFAQEDFVEPRHELVEHVFAQFGDELERLGQVGLKQRLRQVAFVAEPFAPWPFDELAICFPLLMSHSGTIVALL